MSASLALAASANAQAAAASAQAAEAARVACMQMVRGYEHDRAQVAEMRAYADCIERLHPAPLTPDGLIGLKVIVVVLLVAMGVGIAKMWNDEYSTRTESVVMGGILGLCCGAGGLLAVAALCFGIQVLVA